MITEDIFIGMAISFPSTEQRPHFERTAFKVIGKKIFASYLAKDNTANIFLSIAEQALFCKIDSQHIYPVPNKWGEKGVTTFDLNNVPKEIVMEALQSAYNEVRKPKK